MEIDYISFYTKHVDGLSREGKQYKGWCPFHPDKGTKMKGFSVNPSSGLWKCHGSCNRGGNVFTFCELLGIPAKDAPGYDPVARRYSYEKGLKKKFISNKRVLWEKPQGSTKTPYNVEDIEVARTTKKRLWICEGEKDTETMTSVGELAVGLPSASDLGGIENLDFREIEKIILAFDNDDAGKKATEKVSMIIPWANIVRWPEGKKPGYDITDCYEEGGAEGFLDTLETLKESLLDEPPLTDFLKKKFDLALTRDPDVPLGYRLTKFKLLEKNIDGVQPGLYIIGADTSIGKTSICVNLFLDLVITNPDLAGIYFSLDDNMEIIINRFLSCLSEIPINKIQKRIDDQNLRKRLTDAYTRINKFSTDKQLYIYDQSKVTHMDQMEQYIKKHLNKPLFVVVDGLFNLDVQDPTESGIRALNVARANALKRLVDIYRIPVICTAELRKNQGKTISPPVLDDIMETGKFKYNANLVLLLYPEDQNNYDESENPTLEIKYAKNKLSHYRKIDTVTFHRLFSGISDMKTKPKS